MQIAQLRTLLNVMNDIVRKCNNNALGMVMGDFNSTPESAVYQFIRAGELDCQTVPRKHVSGQVQGTSWPAALEKVGVPSPLVGICSVLCEKGGSFLVWQASLNKLVYNRSRLQFCCCCLLQWL